jgi:hypothetical protein
MPDLRVHRNAAVKPPRPPKRSTPVSQLQVPSSCWEAALEIAGGDAGRLEVYEEDGSAQVRVVNRSRAPGQW